MLYPKITNVKKSRELISFSAVTSAFIGTILIFINYVTSHKLNWSIVALAGIAYVWCSVFYALSKGVNLAKFTFIQMMLLSVLLVIIDYDFGFTKWSFSIGIPIVIMITNITMMIISIAKYKKYVKYALYEILVLIISIFYNMIVGLISKSYLAINFATFIVSFTNLCFILALNGKTLKIEFDKKFHI